MLIDTNSIKIDNIPMVQYLISAKFGYHKIWAKDSGRNMAFETTGTLGGIFPKVTLTFGRLNKEQMHIISALLNKATISLQYYDPEFEKIVTTPCYSGDWEFDQKVFNKSESFSVGIITRKKRVRS